MRNPLHFLKIDRFLFFNVFRNDLGRIIQVQIASYNEFGFQNRTCKLVLSHVWSVFSRQDSGESPSQPHGSPVRQSSIFGALTKPKISHDSIGHGQGVEEEGHHPTFQVQVLPVYPSLFSSSHKLIFFQRERSLTNVNPNFGASLHERLQHCDYATRCDFKLS